MSGFTSPNHTQTPNDLFDILLPEMGEAELKIVLWAVRKTLGYHKGSDEISVSQFMKATGLSKQGVLNGIEQATSRGILKLVSKGKRGVGSYALVYTVDQSTELTSSGQPGRPDELSTGQRRRPTKEMKPKENLKETHVPEKTAHDRPRNPLFDATSHAWNNSNGGYVGKLMKFLTGKCTKKDGQYFRWQIKPAMTPREIVGFKLWRTSLEREMPSVPETIHRLVEEFRGVAEYQRILDRAQIILDNFGNPALPAASPAQPESPDDQSLQTYDTSALFDQLAEQLQG